MLPSPPCLPTRATASTSTSVFPPTSWAHPLLASSAATATATSRCSGRSRCASTRGRSRWRTTSRRSTTSLRPATRSNRSNTTECNSCPRGEGRSIQLGFPPMAVPQLVTTAADHAPLALLVDRDPDTRKMYAEYLRLSAACDTDEAEDGREALVKAMTRHPDVIVTETRLPGINGFDLCTLLRRDTSTSGIPIIFVTGDAFEADVRRAERAGADAFLPKPCLPEKLAGEIRRVLHESMELRQRG